MSTGGAIKMGRAFVELFVEDNKLYRGLDLAGAKFMGWGNQLRSMGAQLGGAGGAVLGPLVAGLADVTKRASDLTLLADRIGEPVAATSSLAGGFERAGVGADQFGGIIEGLKTKVAEAADANGYLLDNLRSLGPAARLAGLPARDMLNQIAESIERIPSAVNQLRAAKALGLEGILPQLRKGKEGIDELFANPGFSEEEGRQALAVTVALREAWKDFRDTAAQVGLALLPVAGNVAELKDQFKAGLGQVRDWIKENRGAVVAVAAVGAGLVAAGALVVGLGTIVSATGSVVMLTVAGVKLAFGALLSPIGLAAVAAGGLFYLVSTQTEKGREGLAYLGDSFRAFVGRLRESVAGISDAIGAGDWALAWKIGVAAMKAEWENFKFYFQVAWNVTKSLFVDGWKDAVAAVKIAFIEMGAFVARQMAAITRGMLNQLAAAAAVAGPAGVLLGRKIRQAGAAVPTDDRINADRDAATGAVRREREKEQREADAHRDKAARDAEQARRDARAELAGLNALARWRAEFAAMPWLGEDEEGEAEAAPAGRFHGPSRLADVVKGGFGSAAIEQQMGMGDNIPQQQLDALRSLNVKADSLPQMAQDLNRLASGGKMER